MSRSYIELGDQALGQVEALMHHFGTTDVAETVARALGLATVASRYFQDDVLTVLNPRSDKAALEDQLVDLVLRAKTAGEKQKKAA